jgi:hypothetical protein
VAWAAGRLSDTAVPCGQRPVAKFTGRAQTAKGCGKWAKAGGVYYTVERDDVIGPMKFSCYVKLG